MARSDWTEFVKKCAKEKGVPYACALSEAKAPYQEWKKKQGKGTTTRPRKNP